MNSDEVHLRLTDTTLRDGSHAVRHQFTTDQVRSVVTGLACSGVSVIEVTHGDGLAGSSFNYGFSLVDEAELIKTAVAASGSASVAALLLPGVGTLERMRAASDAGVSIIRIATHCTEADVASQHFKLARELGLETVGFLMLSHMAPPSALAAQAREMVDAGAQCVYVVDSAGAMLSGDVSERVEAMVDELGAEAQVGFHGHNNLCFGVANSVAAYRAGARQIDGATRALGAGAGNAATEVLVAVFNHLGVQTGVDLDLILETAEEIVKPIMGKERVADRNAIVMGAFGVYSSFLEHALRVEERYGVPAHAVLKAAGRQKLVGGQEDQLVNLAIGLKEAGTP